MPKPKDVLDSSEYLGSRITFGIEHAVLCISAFGYLFLRKALPKSLLQSPHMAARAERGELYISGRVVQ